MLSGCCVSNQTLVMNTDINLFADHAVQSLPLSTLDPHKCWPFPRQKQKEIYLHHCPPSSLSTTDICYLAVLIETTNRKAVPPPSSNHFRHLTWLMELGSHLTRLVSWRIWFLSFFSFLFFSFNLLTN
jgi:hypothetical protein